MPLRNRFKPAQGEVNEARTSSSSATGSIVSTPYTLTTADTNAVPTSDIGEVRAFTPTPPNFLPPRAQSPSAPTSNPLPNLLANPLTEEQASLSQSVECPQNIQYSPPTTTPVPDARNTEKGALIQNLPPQSNPRGISPTVNPVSKREIATCESNNTSGSATTASKVSPNPTWEGLHRFRRALRKVSGAFGPLEPVIGGLSDCIGIYEDTMKAQQGYETLKSELESLFSLLSEHFSGNVPLTMTTAMNNICIAIDSELDHIVTKEARGKGRPYLEANKDLDDIMQRYRSIQGHLERLRLNADLSIWKAVDELVTETRLKSLLFGPVLAACYDSAEAHELGRRECTPETRKRVLTDLGHWRHDKTQGNVYWLNGMAGTGKTTIASSLCAMLDNSHELGASFFCSRLLPHCRDIKLILPAIAYQLARYSHPLRCALSQALQEEPDLPSKSLPKQIEGLIAKPLRKVANALPADLVVVVDALDECDDSQAVGFLLELLVKHAPDLPIKLFVSSRPEPQIRQMISDTKPQLVLHELDESIVKEDIRLYLRTELDGLLSSVSDADLSALVDQAGILFIYAATVVRFVKSSAVIPIRRKRFRDLIGISGSGRSHQEQAVDALYDTVLTSAFDNLDLQDDEKAVIKLVIDTVICTQEPLTVTAMARLLEIEDEALVQAALDPFWSVLRVSDGDGMVTTLHASFPEYMLDPVRSKERSCRAETHHSRLAKLCFQRIEKNKAQFNICGLESSFLFDDQVPRLEERVTRAIPHELMYACQYWALHLELGEPSVNHLQELNGLLSERLLLWIEILNLRKRAVIAASMLSKAQVWCNGSDAPQETKDMVHDAWRFATVFATSSVSRSTPHLYVSMLASWGSQGRLLDRYKHRMKGLVRVEGTELTRTKPAPLSTFPVNSHIMSVAFSSNGMRIVSGSDDKTVRVWDATSALPLTDPIVGHTASVTSVTFSPDSMCIVSASRDQTIRLWDATSGKPIADPITGHTSSVTSVAFSPDSMRVVSGSEDQTIRVWDASSRILVTGPITGHSSWVTSVAFSPDGTRIVSGSRDKTIRVWDAASGRSVMDPITGHTSSVTSVAYSPDSMRIVSGSQDRTIRVWDASSRMLVTGPITGHSSWINSVAFSPDGMRIVSGSDDKTIRVWDATSGKPVVDPITGDKFSIQSVAFSPDGMRIVSGGWDSTVCVWDSTSWKPVASPHDASTQRSLSMLLWANRLWMFGSAGDQLACLWDSMTSRCMPEPMSGPTVSATLGSLLTNAVPSPPTSERMTMRGRDESRWRLIEDLIQTVLKNQIMSAWFMPVNPLWGHPFTILCMLAFAHHTSSGWAIVYSFYAFRLCVAVFIYGQILVQRAMGIRAVAGTANTFLELNCNRYPLVSVLLALARFSASVAIKSLGITDKLLNNIVMWVILNINNLVMWIQDAMIHRFAQVPKTCLHLVAVLLGIAYYSTKSIVTSANIYLLEKNSLVWWKAAYSIRSVAASPDGRRIASGSGDKTVRVWHAASGIPLTSPLTGHTASINSVAFSPDGMCIVSGSDDKTVRVWDATSGKPVVGPITGHTSSVTSTAFSPNSTLIASGSTDQTVRVWHVTSGMPLTDPITGHKSWVTSVAFSPDGTRIVSGSIDTTIRVWDTKSGKQLMCLPVYDQDSSWVWSVAFLPDGMRMVSVSNDLIASKDWLVRVWDTRMPKVRYNLWTLGREGWVLDQQGRRLLWLPTDLRQCVLPSQNLYLISTRGFVALNFDGANIGESWTESYTCT